MITPISPCIHCNWNFRGCRTQLLNIHFFHMYLTPQDDDPIWLWQFDESHIYIIFFTHLKEFRTFYKFIKTTTTLSWSWCHLKKPNQRVIFSSNISFCNVINILISHAIPLFVCCLTFTYPNCFMRRVPYQIFNSYDLPTPKIIIP